MEFDPERLPLAAQVACLKWIAMGGEPAVLALHEVIAEYVAAGRADGDSDKEIHDFVVGYAQDHAIAGRLAARGPCDELTSSAELITIAKGMVALALAEHGEHS